MFRDLFWHYAIILTVGGHAQVLARLRTKAEADQVLAIVHTRPAVEGTDVRWERRRGLHPMTASRWCMGLLLPVLLLLAASASRLLIISSALVWVLMGLVLLLSALLYGFLSTGQRWIRGGRDDR